MENDQRIKAYKALLSLFSSATGLPIGLFEVKDEQTVGLLSAGSLERFEEHCKLIQSFPGGREACNQAQCHRAKKVITNGEIELTCCHAGIWNQISPVKINGKTRAIFVYGETLIDDSDYMQTTFNRHLKAAETLKLSNEDTRRLYDALNKVKRSSLKRLEEFKNVLSEVESTLFSLFEEELRQSRNLEKTAHELQTRLQAIISLSENIVTGSYSQKSSSLRREAARILSKAESLATIVNNLGGFQERYQFRLTKLRPIFSRAWSTYEDEAKDRNIRLKISLDKIENNEPELELSPRHTEWAINNLVHNAIKYSFTGSADRPRFIVVIGYPEKDYYVFSISNYGVGIKKHEIERGLIFHDGYQGELTRGGNRTGSGKGLVYVKRVIDSHNGKIIITSKPVSENETNEHQPYLTIITISLPIKQNEGGHNL